MRKGKNERQSQRIWKGAMCSVQVPQTVSFQHWKTEPTINHSSKRSGLLETRQGWSLCRSPWTALVSFCVGSIPAQAEHHCSIYTQFNEVKWQKSQKKKKSLYFSNWWLNSNSMTQWCSVKWNKKTTALSQAYLLEETITSHKQRMSTKSKMFGIIVTKISSVNKSYEVKKVETLQNIP